MNSFRLTLCFLFMLSYHFNFTIKNFVYMVLCHHCSSHWAKGKKPVADLRDGGVETGPPLPSQGFDPAANPKRPPFYYLEISFFDWLTLKFFKSRFDGEITQLFFWLKLFKKCLKRLFWPVFSKVYLRHRKFYHNGAIIAFCERSWEKQDCLPKKVDIIFNFLLFCCVSCFLLY